LAIQRERLTIIPLKSEEPEVFYLPNFLQSRRKSLKTSSQNPGKHVAKSKISVAKCSPFPAEFDPFAWIILKLATHLAQKIDVMSGQVLQDL